jgi:hypothetical protein
MGDVAVYLLAVSKVEDVSHWWGGVLNMLGAMADSSTVERRLKRTGELWHPSAMIMTHIEINSTGVPLVLRRSPMAFSQTSLL